MKNMIFIAVFFAAVSCGSGNSKNSSSASVVAETQSVEQPKEQIAPPKRYGIKVLETFPHDTKAYTQGLYWHNGNLHEGTGQYGESSLRQVDLQTGKATLLKNLPKNYFGEGIALLGGKIYQLTWENGICFVYNADTFEPVSQFSYQGEGWGITTDGNVLYMSDGSDKIFTIDPATFKRTGEISVRTDMGKIEYLNELEWIDGLIWANIYTTDVIVMINPQTGIVKGMADLSSLKSLIDQKPETDVLNGIAYDPDTKSIYVTGKYWNKIFKIELTEK